MAHRYLDESLADVRARQTIALTGAEARHAVTVSRVTRGEQLSLGNGAGLVVHGSVEIAERDRLELRVESVQRHPEPSPTLTLVQALAKGDRAELAVQAATELGVDRIAPWAASRSIVRWDAAKAVKGRDRWAAIAREAAKQSLRPWLPEVGELLTTKQLTASATRSRMLVLEPTAPVALSAVQLDARDLTLVVGPEGGIDPVELESLTAAGAEAVRLGPEVLRTSTAGPAAIAVLSAALGRW